MALNFSLNQTLSQNITAQVSPGVAEAVTTLKPLVVLLIGIAVYSLFIFKFYRFLAARDILKLKMHKKYAWKEGFFQKFTKTFFYLLEYVVLTPIMVFFWFSVLAILLLFLSRNPPEVIMLISMALIGAVRVCAYYSEALSQDLAKMIPFALLGVFIVDMNYSSVQNLIGIVKDLLAFFRIMLFYLLFVVALELLMRIIRLITQAVSPVDEEEQKENS